MEYAQVKKQITDMLVQKKEFGDEENMLELGLNSLKIMRVVSQWRKQGVKLSFGELMEEPTLGAWWQLIQQREKGKAEAVPKQKPLGDCKINTPFPLTDVQYAYWIGRREEQSLGGIGCHAYLEFDGAYIDPERLKKAWNTLQEHHSMLRARFLENGTQEIMEKPYCQTIQVFDLTKEEEKEAERKLLKIRESLSHRKLSVEKGEVAGIALSQLPGEKSRLHVDIDLLISDVQSLQIILRDLAAAYTGKELPKESKCWNFAEYLHRQEESDAKEKQQAKEYWTNRLEQLPMGPSLPLSKRPEEVLHTHFNRRIFRLTLAQWESLSNRAKEYKTTPAMVLLTAYSIILERWSTNKRFLINIPLFNRKTEWDGMEDAVADFTTLLLLEVNCEENPSFYKLLSKIQKQMHQDMSHSKYSGVQVQRDLAQLYGQQQSVAPIVFACNLGTPLVNDEFRKNLGSFSYMISQTPQVWLDFQTYEDEEGLMLTWDTVDELFPENMIQDMMDSFGKLLLELIDADWNQNFDVLPEKQKKWIETESKMPAITPQCLHSAFLEWADKTPDSIALVDTEKGISFTYGELKKRVLSVASALIHAGIQEEPIAVTLPRGYEQIEAVLAVLVSGNFYVPVSVGQPEERRNLIHEKTGIRYVITNQKVQSTLKWNKDITVFLLEQMEEKTMLDTYKEVSKEQSAYIIMTSGTTGLPKGVEIAHQSAWNTIEEINRSYQVGPEDTALAISAMDFDLSVYDVFGILGAGGKLILIPEEEKRNAEYWFSKVTEYQVTIWNSVPVLLDMLCIYAESQNAKLPLRAVMLSGDWIGLDLPERVAKLTKNCRFIAMGGATEASIWSNCQEVTLPIPKNWNSIPYGRPLRGQAYRVLDQTGRDCPYWTEGELCIGGYGVAKGYRSDEELTKAKFKEDSLGRWYHTGDNGRIWSDGTIEFLGRKDNQVKIRGHRIEIGEIEHALSEAEGVKRGIVEAIGEKTKEKYLAAFLEADCKELSPLVAYQHADGNKAGLWNAVHELELSETSEQKKAYEEFISYADKTCISLMQKVLEELGFSQLLQKNAYSLDEIMDKLSIATQWKALMSRWFLVLKENGMLKEKEDAYCFGNWTEAAVIGQAEAAFDSYMEQVSSHMKAMLLGKEEAKDVFYKEGANLSPNDLLKILPGGDAVLEPVIQAVNALKQKGTKEQPLRVLELGTRDGAVSQKLYSLFKDANVEYCYADSSHFFLNQAKEKRNQEEKIDFKLFSLEKSVQEQDVSLHAYDCIFALHSLHRVKDARNAVKQVTDLLAPGGILCMEELTAKTYLQELTASFLENGFDNITDDRKQTKEAVLSADRWKTYFEAQGLEHIKVLKETYGRSILLVQQNEKVPVFTEDALKTELEDKLPDYMVPRAFYFMEKLPTTSNGKIDRKELKKLCKSGQKAVQKIQPATETEEKLLNLWKELFQNESLSVLDNYFSVGGDSLVATKLLSEVQKQFNRKISIAAVFEHPTVRALAAVLEKADKSEMELPVVVAEPERQYEPFPLTDVQYAYWLGRSGVYDLGNVSTHCYFELDAEQLDLDKAQEALNVLIKKHGMMRVMIQPDGQQRILESVPEFKIPVMDIRNLEKAKRETELENKRREMSHQVIHTEQWPLFDFAFTRFEGEKVRIHISFDNLIFDGWSMFHILNEWAAIYHGAQNGEALTFSFRDYVLGLEKVKHTAIYKKDEAYWQNRIEGLSKAPELPLAKREDEITDQRFVRRTGRLSAEEWNCLKKKAGDILVTPSVLLISAYSEVLRLFSTNKDFTINLTQFNRTPFHPEVNQLVGDFTTLTLLEVKKPKESSFKERCVSIQKQLSMDMEHSFYSAIEVERALKKQQGNAKGAIMPIVFTSGLGIEQWNDGKWLGKLAYNISQTPQVWLDHQVVEMDGELCLFWDSVDALFYPGMLDEMFEAYVGLLKRLAKEDTLLDEKKSSLVSAKISEERRKANETAKELEANTLDGMFLKACQNYKEKEALVTANRRMTYQEIQEEASYLCEQLTSYGIQQEETVAIMMHKGWEQVVAVFGVLFAGGAYLPIDIDNPEERIQKILKDSHTRVVFTTKEIAQEKDWLEQYHSILVEGKKTEHLVTASTNKEQALAYVIYTSGTTGMPKGVMISHQGAVNTIQAINKKYQVGEEDCAFGISNLHFDLSVYDLFGLLGAGGKLVIPADKKAKEPKYWVEILNQERVTIWNSVPAFMEMLVEYEEYQKQLKAHELRLVLMSGDWIGLTLSARIYELFCDVQVISLGGATEASIWSNDFAVPRQIPEDFRSIPYGKPLANQKYYVLNEELQDCPDYVPGTLYIAGTGVAKGYFHDKDKTREKFICRPGHEEVLYCTGDMGRYWKDGNIEFLGRLDNQLKINGYRVELGEIESALNSIKGIEKGIVIMAEEKNNHYLVAFVTGEDSLEETEVKSQIAKKVPEYAVPNYIVKISEFPLSKNGKVNRAALNALWKKQGEHAKEEAVMPRNEEEERIWNAFYEVLGISIGVKDGFFNNGGDSLKGIRLMNQINKELNCDISLKNLYEHSTVEQLTQFIASQQNCFEEGTL